MQHTVCRFSTKELLLPNRSQAQLISLAWPGQAAPPPPTNIGQTVVSRTQTLTQRYQWRPQTWPEDATCGMSWKFTKPQFKTETTQ